MGYYVNPKSPDQNDFLAALEAKDKNGGKIFGCITEEPSTDRAKIEFLRVNGQLVSEGLVFSYVPKGQLPVVLVNNGHFLAAGIAYSESELRAFTNPNDRRDRVILLVDIEKLVKVSGADFAEFALKTNLVDKDGRFIG